MRLDNRIVLAIIAALTLSLFPVAILTSGPLRIILSFICLIFFPGYALLSVLFPRQGEIGAVERIALSLGASIALVPIMGFLLNFSPWGIRLIPILISSGAFILLMSITGVIRQQLLPSELRFEITLNVNWARWKDIKGVKKVLIITGSLAIASLIISAIIFTAALPESQVTTEFYILDAGGKTNDYPRQVRVNDPADITAVVVNHEDQPITYSIQIVSSEAVIGEANTGLLSPGEKWEGKAIFTSKTAGKDQKIEFFLYKAGDKEPYFKDPLYIYVDADN
jgi:uncharacterized membrane protein